MCSACFQKTLGILSLVIFLATFVVSVTLFHVTKMDVVRKNEHKCKQTSGRPHVLLTVSAGRGV